MKKIMLSSCSLLMLFWFWSNEIPPVNAQEVIIEVCNNNLDDDGDGKVDCQDHGDCNKDPACGRDVAVDPCKGALEQFTLSDNSPQCCRPPHMRCTSEVCTVPECHGQLTGATGINGEALCCDFGDATPVP